MLSEQNRALVESALDAFARAMWDANKHISTSDLNRLLDAARTEGRGEGEPVAWRFKDGDGSWVVTAERALAERWALRSSPAEPLYASPIREPEISREAVHRILRTMVLEVLETTGGASIAPDAATSKAADAILNLAPVGLKADFTKALPGGALDDTTFEAVEEALDRADAPMRGENGRWLKITERIAALAAPVGGRGEGWRPIETAPKDGTPVLLSRGGDFLFGCWSGHGPDDPAGCWDADVEHGGQEIDPAPDHWQPLPPPPQEQGGMK